MGSHQSSSSGRPDGHSLFCPSAPLQERGMRRRGTQATPMITAVPSANRQTVHRSHSLAHLSKDRQGPRVDLSGSFKCQLFISIHAPCMRPHPAPTASAPCMRLHHAHPLRLRRACARVQCNLRDLRAPRAAPSAQLAPCTGPRARTAAAAVPRPGHQPLPDTTGAAIYTRRCL